MAKTDAQRYIEIVFDGPPSHLSPRFVEVEYPADTSVRVGEWIDRGNGYWALRLTSADFVTWIEGQAKVDALVAEANSHVSVGGVRSQEAHTALDRFIARVTEARYQGMDASTADRHCEVALGALVEAAMLAASSVAEQLRSEDWPDENPL